MPIAAASPTTERFFDKPIFTPAQYALAPFTWVIGKVTSVFQTSIGYFVRIGVFSFGEWNRSWFKGKVIDLYTGGIWSLLMGGNFSTSRLEQAFVNLGNIGGIRTPTFSKDGTKLDTMIIRYKDVKQAIEKQGGKIVESVPVSDLENDRDEPVTLCRENRSRPHQYVDLILPQKNDPNWKEFCKKTLNNLSLEKTTVQMSSGELVDGYIMNHWNEKNPTRPKKGQCFIRSNSPTESYACAKRDIMRRVLLGQDVLCYDPPGTWESEGIPSEGGYYLGGEAMVEKAVHEYGYQWKDIWVEGFCLGGAVATHLKKKYHDNGINLFVQNTFDKMKHTLGSQVFPASHIAQFGLREVKSQDPQIESLVTQDGFDNISKLESLIDKPKNGTTIVVNTDTDQTIHPKSHHSFASAADRVSKKTYSILYHHPDKTKNGHRFDVLSDPKTWRQVVTYITAKDYQRVLNTHGWFSSLWGG